MDSAQPATKKRTRPELFLRWSWYDGLAILILCLMPLFYFAPVILNNQTFYFRDISIVYMPLNIFNLQTIFQGELPLWNPYLHGGYPTAADPQSSFLSPLNLIFLLPLPVTTTYTWYIVIHYALAGVFTFLLTRWGLYLGPIASFVAGLSFAFGGAMLVHLTQFPIVSTLTWMPLILLLYILAFEKSKIIYAIAAGIVMAVQISKSQPQMVLYTAGILILYACFVTGINFCAGKGIRSFIPFGKLLLVFLIGAGLSAYQLIYTLELIQQSNRAGGITYEIITVLSYPPIQLIKLLVPHFFGSFKNYAGSGSYTEFHVYAGVLALILPIFAWLKPKDWRVWFFTTLMTICLILSFGDFTPLYHLLQYVPIVNFFRVPARWILLVTFCLSILAAYGVQTLVDNQWKIGPRLGKPVSRIGLIILFGFIVGLMIIISGAVLWDVAHSSETCTSQDFVWRPRCVFGNPNVYTRYAALMEHKPEERNYFVVERTPGDSYEVEQQREYAAFQQRIQRAYLDMIQSLGLSLLVVSLGLGLIFVHWQGWVNGRIFGMLIALLFLFDILTYGGRQLNPTTDAAYFLEEPDTAQYLKQVAGAEPYRIFPTITWIPEQYNTDYVLSTLHFNFPALYGIESMEGGMTLPLKRHTAYMQQAIGQASGMQLLSLANVKYIITEWNLEDNPGLTLVFEGERQNIFENLQVLPRVLVVHRAEVLNESSTILNHLASPSFDPTQTVILEEPPTVSLPTTPPLIASEAQVVRRLHNQIEIDVTMTDNGFLFLSDVYYPGWNAYVDGEPAHIYQANYLFRAVELTKGNHKVEFRYEPQSLKIGLGISLLTVIFLAAWMIRVQIKSRFILRGKSNREYFTLFAWRPLWPPSERTVQIRQKPQPLSIRCWLLQPGYPDNPAGCRRKENRYSVPRHRFC